jgi:hypothetical protein
MDEKNKNTFELNAEEHLLDDMNRADLPKERHSQEEAKGPRNRSSSILHLRDMVEGQIISILEPEKIVIPSSSREVVIAHWDFNANTYIIPNKYSEQFN